MALALRGSSACFAAPVLRVASPEVCGNAVEFYASFNVQYQLQPALTLLRWSCLQIALPLAGGSALGIYAALHIHQTLEFIGVLGVLATIINKALSYDSPGAALEDAKGAVSGAQKALSKLGSIKPPAGLKVPSMPSLPKMPTVPQAGGVGGARSAAAVSGGGGGAAGATLSAAAVAGTTSGGRDVDVGEETEQELVD